MNLEKMNLTMNIPHAADARRAIEKGEYEKATKQAAEVEKLIHGAISKGQKYVGGDGYLEPSVKAKLESMGYTCTSSSQCNEEYYSISW